jgi:hypothetical protein
MRQERRKAVRRIFIVGALAGTLLTGGGVLAQNPHSGGSTGQPNESCQAGGLDVPNLPVPGFNTNGFNNVATAHYAGSQPQNSNNTHSVSQYDVACFQQTTH